MSAPTYRAVLDRFEGERAVLLLEADGDQVDELVVPVALLPPEGREQDAVFVIRVEDDTVTTVTYDPAATRRRADRAQRRFDALSRPLSDDEEP